MLSCRVSLPTPLSAGKARDGWRPRWARAEARLVIAGGNHPQAAGYVESIREQCAGDPNIEFTGYLEEERLPDLFQSSSVAVMPYSSSAGCSGVAHLACAYDVPVLCADLADFRQMADSEESAIEFYKPGDATDLARCLIHLLDDREVWASTMTEIFSTSAASKRSMVR